MKTLIFLSLISLLTLGCTNNKKSIVLKKKDIDKNSEYIDLQKNASLMFGTLPKIATTSKNVLTEDKVTLGKKLYFDKNLSKDKTQSCNTCHNLETFGVDNLSTSPGNDGNFGSRNSPTVLNAALHIAQFWDGREPDVEAQAGGPILNPIEMAMPDKDIVIKRLSAIQEYQELFTKAFPDDNNPISYQNLQNAIGAFERKLITPSKFDDFLEGDLNALTNKEKEGLKLFMNNGCTACHSGNVLGGNIYQKFGLFDDYWKYTKSKIVDKGKYEVTKNESDQYVFKSPSLRNIAKTYPYFHDGSVNDLREAVQIMAKVQLNKEFNDNELDAIIAFLNSLTGKLPNNL